MHSAPRVLEQSRSRMNIDLDKPWFVRLDDDGVVSKEASNPGTATLGVEIDGRLMNVPTDSSVAAAMMMAGVQGFGTRPLSAAARAPYCMMGLCFECVVDIDGVPGQQACLTTVRAGMRIHTRGAATTLPNTLRAARSTGQVEEGDDVQQ